MGNENDDVQRDASGRWLPGNSGNRAGRPVGASGVGLRMVREYAIELLPSLMEEARSGNWEIAKFLVGMGLPKLRASLVPEELPNSPAGILESMSAGEISADVGNEALNAHLSVRKISELDDLTARVQRLEELIATNGGVHEWTA